MSEIDPNIIKQTQDTLGKIIKKPPLTEKLLSRPPFRFLHDICTSVIKSTGFMSGLFDESEMQSENIRDKDAKIAFLQKVIDIVSLACECNLSVKPVSIVGGKEAEKTNELLQKLATAINKNVDNDDYVGRVLRGEKSKPSSSKDKSNDKANDAHKTNGKKEEEREKHSKERDRGSKEREHKEREHRDKDKGDQEKEKERGGDRDKHRGERDKEKSRENRSSKERDHGKERSSHKDRERKEDEKSRERKKEGSSGSRERERDQKRRSDKDDKPDKKEKPSDDSQPKSGGDDSTRDSATRLQRPSSAKGHRVKRDGHRGDTSDDEDLVKSNNSLTNNASEPEKRTLVRPPSAKRAAPKPKRPEDNQRITSASGNQSGKVSGVIIEQAQDSDDDQFVVEETVGGELNSAGTGAHLNTTEENGEQENAEHGGLVTKILQTKKEYDVQTAKPVKEDQTSSVNDITRKRDRAAVEKEIERLRQSLQTLTRSANPLGKVMDFIQEDLDAMHKELERWRNENKDLTMQLKREQSITDSTTEPLTAQLNELELTITEQHNAIAAIKSKILQNDERISKLLNSVCVS